MIARYGLKSMDEFSLSDKFSIIKEQYLSVLRSRIFQIIISSILSLVALYVFLNGSLLHKSRDVTVNKYPEGVARFLKDIKIAGNMFNPYDWGGYLIWALYPDYKVFVDGRGLDEKVVLDGVKIVQAYQGNANAEQLPEWKALLNAYEIKFIITYSVNSFSGQLVPLIYAVLTDPEWNLIYMDDISLIFLKDSPENKDILQRHGMPKEWLWHEVIKEAALKSGGFWSANIQSNFSLTMGDAFFAGKNYREAKDAYLKALKSNPENSFAREKLAILGYYGH